MSRPRFQLPASVQPVQDTSLFGWIEQRVRPRIRGEARVYFLLPDGFAAYARILHPAYQRAADDPVRWSEIAAQVGTTLHPGADFEKLAGSRIDDWDQPFQGQLPEVQARELVGILQQFTASRRCLFAIWEGQGGMDNLWQGAVSLRLPGRVYGIFGGTLGSALELLNQGVLCPRPSLWWPEDRAWFVGTGIDELSTFVGGSRACIDGILASRMETFEVSPDARFDRDADTINGG